jgi:hypothetical protein
MQLMQHFLVQFRQQPQLYQRGAEGIVRQNLQESRDPLLNHGGEALVTDNQPKGTIMVLRLPACSQSRSGSED